MDDNQKKRRNNYFFSSKKEFVKLLMHALVVTVIREFFSIAFSFLFMHTSNAKHAIYFKVRTKATLLWVILYDMLLYTDKINGTTCTFQTSSNVILNVRMPPCQLKWLMTDNSVYLSYHTLYYTHIEYFLFYTLYYNYELISIWFTFYF